MTQLYARVFVQILDSSIAENWQTRHGFEDLLKLADGGLVDMTRQAIARRTNVPLEVVKAAIAKLESPDPDSRDAAEQGRRIVRLDDHRDWGWRIVNWERYEAIRSKDDQRQKTAERVRRHREKASEASPSPKPPTQDTDTDTDTDSEGALPKRYRPLQSVTGGERCPAGAGPAASGEGDAEWLAGVKADAAYAGLDVDREHAKMIRWCREHRKQASRRRFINWLNRCERPLTTGTTGTDHSNGF